MNYSLSAPGKKQRGEQHENSLINIAFYTSLLFSKMELIFTQNHTSVSTYFVTIFHQL